MAETAKQVIASWVTDGARYRLVGRIEPPTILTARASVGGAVLERCDRDAAGGDRWVTVENRSEENRALIGGIADAAVRLRQP